MVSPKVISPTVHVLHSRPRPTTPFSTPARPSQGHVPPHPVLSGASEFIVGVGTSPHDTHGNQPFFTSKWLITTRRETLLLVFV